MYAFRYRDDSQNKSQIVSKYYSTNIKFDEYKKPLDGEDCQKESDNYFFVKLIMKSIFGT